MDAIFAALDGQGDSDTNAAVPDAQPNGVDQGNEVETVAEPGNHLCTIPWMHGGFVSNAQVGRLSPYISKQACFVLHIVICILCSLLSTDAQQGHLPSSIPAHITASNWPAESPSAQAAEPKTKGKKKKKGKAAADTDDIDALLAEIGDAPAQPDTASAAAPTNGDAVAATVADEEADSAQPEPAKGKGKKKKKGKAAADTEDIDALLAELDGPPAEQAAHTVATEAAVQSELAQPEAIEQPDTAAADTGKGKKKKKKGKAGAAKDDEDLDAVLAELGMGPVAETGAQPTGAEQPSTDAQAPAEGAAADEADDDGAADGAGDGKV